MWYSFLRDSGRWSLYHFVGGETDEVYKTMCGWEYSKTLDRQGSSSARDLITCDDCKRRRAGIQDIIRSTID